MSVLSPSEKGTRPIASFPQVALPLDAGISEARQIGTWDAVCRAAVLRRLSSISLGQLTLADPCGRLVFGNAAEQHSSAMVEVRHPRAYRLLATGGNLGAAEGYLQGLWNCDDLVNLFRLLSQNALTLQAMDRGLSRLRAPVRWFERRLRRNTRAGSRRNISAHYDLSNEFFALFLDPTMTYSSGIFEQPQTTLEQASCTKYERLCRQLQLTPADHVLEIGTGWGGFAEHAASRYGCRVTTTTISREQFEYARRRIATAGLADRVTLLCRDYRDLNGHFDKLVSIEMIEAVGHENLATYFRKSWQLLRPGGLFALQAITMPEQRYHRYRNSTDFIQKYIFPGGCLPSVNAITQAAAATRSFRLIDLHDFALHYARTLSLWRHRFRDNLPAVRRLGFDDRFIRAWEYYLSYCEAGFQEERIGLAQMTFRKLPQ